MLREVPNAYSISVISRMNMRLLALLVAVAAAASSLGKDVDAEEPCDCPFTLRIGEGVPGDAHILILRGCGGRQMRHRHICALPFIPTSLFAY